MHHSRSVVREFVLETSRSGDARLSSARKRRRRRHRQLAL